MNRYWSKRLKHIFGKLIEGKRPLYVACFLAGLCLGLLIKQKLPVRFKEELDLLPLLQVVATLIIALLITHYGKQRADDQRVEKEILIEQLRDCQTKAKEIYSEFYGCCEAGQVSDVQSRKFVQAMRDLSNQLNTLKKVIGYFGEPPQLAQRWDKSWGFYLDFKTSVTGLSPSTDVSNFKIRNDAESHWRKFDEHLMAFIFETNRL